MSIFAKHRSIVPHLRKRGMQYGTASRLRFTCKERSNEFSVKKEKVYEVKILPTAPTAATMTFTSTDVTTGVLDIKAQAASVDTGSGMKDGKLKSKDFFDAENNPLITFHSTKIVQTGPNTFDIPGTFTIRGVSKPETLSLTVSGIGTGQGEVKGTMAFDRKDYGMNSGIPFIKIADRVEVEVDLFGKRVSGPPMNLKK
jgi:polyisoprenoid-binding protein YceI